MEKNNYGDIYISNIQQQQTLLQCHVPITYYYLDSISDH